MHCQCFDPPQEADVFYIPPMSSQRQTNCQKFEHLIFNASEWLIKQKEKSANWHNRRLLES